MVNDPWEFVSDAQRRSAHAAGVDTAAIARDLTEHERLVEARAYLAAIVESSDDAIITKDLEGIIQSSNAAAERLFGYTDAELIGQPVRILIPPDRQAEEDEILARLRRGERIDHFETVRVAKDGRLLDISLSVSPVRDATGTIIGVAKIARDITEQERAAAALATQREWFRVTLASIGDAVIATDVRGQIVFMNPIAEHLTGWRVDAAKGRSCTEVFTIVNEQTRRAVGNPVSRVLAEGAVVGFANHTILIAADGTERPIDDSGAPIRNRDGRIVGVVLIFRDVTERRRGDAERQMAAVEHERLLEAERVARIEAERASRVKDDFVAMVSHELRTPLNAILGWTQLMTRAPQDAALVGRGLDVVARNTRVQAQLIADLLDISRIVSGKMQLDIQSVDLVSIVTDAIETIQQEANAKGVIIRQELDTDVGPIAGDPGRLQQVVGNLLSNAIKFTPGGGEVQLVLRRTDHDAEISVSDTGVGIRPELLLQIFERFHQADRSITRRFGGLGLGLSIVKNLVELHGGTVRADSPGEGKGATFTITLPSSSVDAAPEATIATTASHDDALRAISLDAIRILVVEDEPATREFLKLFLESNGARVATAASATEALSMFPTVRPEILISDIGLPEIDGHDLMEQIRQKDVRAGGGIPAVALTAYARSEDRTRALLAGYQSHLAKPVEPNELLATIASFGELIEAQRRSE